MTRKRCFAKFILGDRISSTWTATCEERANGLCCKDCRFFETCLHVCSRIAQGRVLVLLPSFKREHFSCIYYVTRTEALFARLEGEDYQGVDDGVSIH